MHLDSNHTIHNDNRTVNGSTLPVNCMCVDPGPSTPQVPVVEHVEIEAFMYIVVVILFYATSIVFLLIKYARNDDEEKNLKYQYSEFVKRERFQAPRYKNKIALERTKICLETITTRNGIFNYHTTCPVITVTKCSNESETSSADTIELIVNGGVFTDTNALSNCVDDVHADEKQENSPRVWIDKEAFSEPLSAESVQGGTSLSYDSGVDYLERLGMDDWAVYDNDPVRVNGSMMYIKSYSI